ncbi:unnamed protein product [Callosobruchus maculatus]|uniref:N(6)-L-threonylcarbamoyladenine synthase n=1 Tax=Callosobruchus maculatus TaxID=64391 RepID=A0A653D9A8_CALMS|nr:unnamed protein product [Callosobruchus maculatus]
MEAHALTARMHNSTIEFPFLVLLISGGHCLLAVAEKVDRFLLLGESMDDAPGEAFDKMARRMKLKNLPEYSCLSGGQAFELASQKADNPLQYKFSVPLLQYKNCNFSFAGLKNQLQRHLVDEERQKGVPADGVIPGINNLCAGFQLAITRHLCHRLQRGMEYIERKNLIPDDKKTLVVSGGAACNNFIAEGLRIVCDALDYKMVRPPPKLCTDNGVMIAWNGVEKWREDIDVLTNFDHIDIEKTAPLGISLIQDVELERISCSWVKLKKLTLPQRSWMEFQELKELSRIM